MVKYFGGGGRGTINLESAKFHELQLPSWVSVTTDRMCGSYKTSDLYEYTQVRFISNGTPLLVRYHDVLGTVHSAVHKHTTIYICICRLNTTSFNDIIAGRFRS